MHRDHGMLALAATQVRWACQVGSFGLHQARNKAPETTDLAIDGLENVRHGLFTLLNLDTHLSFSEFLFPMGRVCDGRDCVAGGERRRSVSAAQIATGCQSPESPCAAP